MRPFALALPLAFALPLTVFLPVGFAEAQVGGSYQRSCRDVSQNGSVLSARCRGSNGQYNDTSIDLDRCRGQGVSNSFGRLTCGNVTGSSNPSGGGFGGGGYNGGGDQGGNGYGAPRPRRYYQQPDDGDQGYAPPPRRPRYNPDQDY